MFFYVVLSTSSPLFFYSSRNHILAAPFHYAHHTHMPEAERGLGQSPIREGPWPDPSLSLKFLWYGIAQNRKNRKIWTGHSGYIRLRLNTTAPTRALIKSFSSQQHPQHASTGINKRIALAQGFRVFSTARGALSSLILLLLRSKFANT